MDRKKTGVFFDPSDGKNFEKTVMELLETIAQKEKKEFFRYNELEEKYRILDGYAPDGLKEIEGPLAIEIKYRERSTKALHNQIQMKGLKLKENLPKIKSLLIISNRKISRLEQELNEVEDLNIVIWGKDELMRIKSKFKNKFPSKKKNLTWVIDKFEDEEINKNKDSYMKRLKTAYNNKKLVLFLGAGVSVDEGLPNFEKLTKKLLIKGVTQEKGFKKEKIEKYLDKKLKDYPNITFIRFIEEYLEEEDFYEKIRQSLYEDYNPTINQKSKLYYIRKLCMSGRNRSGVEAIVTYNFDDLLENYLEEQDIKYKLIKNDDDIHAPDEIPIYHVHGFLSQSEDLKDSEQSLVFSEHEYHKQYKDPYCWQNLIQLNLLRENTAIFIGHSMRDPNLRRLLDISSEKFPKAKHFAILENNWDSENTQLNNIFRSMEEETFNDLGVNVIWFEDYDEINDIIQQIKN